MPLNRRQLLAGTAAGAALATLPRTLHAESAGALRNAATNRLAIGDVTVTALSDGFFDAAPGVFLNATPAQVQELTRRAFLPDGPIRLAVNAFLVTQGDQNILIDAGARGFSPTVGRVAGDLEILGVDPGSIKTVLVTHLHGDHVNGLVTADGKAAFPNAELVVAATDHAFWTDAATASRAPEGMQPFFAMAQSALKPYGTRVRLIEKGEVAPGIEAVPLYGHTPGHTGYRVSSGGKSLLVWADIVHATALQFAKPGICVAFDVDPAAAAAMRARVLDMVTSDRTLVAGAHLDFPGAGHVVREGAGYGFVPAPWTYDL